MRMIRAFFMALGMFTAIPCPWRPWAEDARDWMLAALPAVGLVIGLLWAGVAWLGQRLLPSIAAALTLDKRNAIRATAAAQAIQRMMQKKLLKLLFIASVSVIQLSLG